MQVWQSLLFNHIIPSIFNAAVTLLLVLAIFKVFRIKNPATRFMFLFLPLLKPLIILLDNASTAVNMQRDEPVFVGIRMPDPLGLVVAPWQESASLIYDNSMAALAILLAAVVVLVLLIMRWVQLFLFLNSFKKREEIDKVEYARLYEILDALVAKTRVKCPKLVFTSINHIVPFSVGYRMPIIVLSKDLVNSFSNVQLEIMLAHELAHIQRKDSILSWVAIILRDFLFFNPLIRSIYRMLEEEKEKACDVVAVEITRIPPKKIAETLIDVAIFYKTNLTQQKVLRPVLSRGFLFQESSLGRRIDALSDFQSGNGKQLKSLLLFKILTFIALLYIQLALVININGNLLFLR